MVKNPDLRKPFYNWLGTNELNSPTMVATLATEAAYTCGEPWLEQCLHYIEATYQLPFQIPPHPQTTPRHPAR